MLCYSYACYYVLATFFYCVAVYIYYLFPLTPIIAAPSSSKLPRIRAAANRWQATCQFPCTDRPTSTIIVYRFIRRPL